MESINRFMRKAQQQPQVFWQYNFIASLVMFLVFGMDQVLSLILYPMAVAAIYYLVENFVHQSEWLEYVGFYPIPKIDLPLLLSLIINFIIWDQALVILLGVMVYLWLIDRR